ncbi:CFA/I fimbrial subunit C [Enterobacteriaceae bacterium RIT693]|nr:CFA/I fimbrial subunit C [Enterobacteriaceae bacterium RIT693]
MESKIKIRILVAGIVLLSGGPPLLASSIPLPAGFEDIFDARQNGIFNVVYTDRSLGSVAVEYDRQNVLFASPDLIVEQLMAPDMPKLRLSRKALLQKISRPLRRNDNQSFASDEILVQVIESDSTLRLTFPESMFDSAEQANERVFITQRNQSGFVHSHNLNFLSDSWGDSLSVSSNETLNLTGNSYLKGGWSYAKDIDFNLDELALFLESDATRFKAGRQRLSDNFNSSTPSAAYSFFNPVSFDGVSLGYMTDNYLDPGTGAASPVSLYLPQAGTVEVYRNGRMIDIQQFAAGLQYIDTRSWPNGGYDVLLVSKLADGSREEKLMPFFKRNGQFRAGDIEYIIQLGRYDRRQGYIASKTCRQCVSDRNLGANHFADFSVGYTTDSATSLSGGVMMDNDRLYTNASMDIPINSLFVERLYLDGLAGNDSSTAYQLGVSKSYERLGLNASYRDNRYRGDEADFRQYSITPAYDFSTLQFSVTTFLPWNVGFGINYGLNTLFQNYGRKNKNETESWDVTLNRDFTLRDNLNLRMDLGYHRGLNTYASLYNTQRTSEDRFYAQFSLGMRERSYNHYQSLYLRSRINNGSVDNNTYSGDYSLNVDNPEFDRGGKYLVNASINQGPNNSRNGSAGVVMDNAAGYTAAGITQSLDGSHYNQQYLSQRSGFAIGEGDIAWGKLDNTAAIIVDATDLPEDQYFETRNRSMEPVVVKGGQKTTLTVTPYQKVDPKVEQVFTGKTDAFYNLTTESTAGWALPGQVYKVKLAATKNQTVTGRLYFEGGPLANARVVGGNAMSDEEGLFVGDFSLKADERLAELTVKKEGKAFVCPLLEENVKLTQGIMQIREVNCETQ